VKFVDETTIFVQSGKGGPGCVSFRRERFIPKGGPDGGDGGKGGDVVFRATRRKRTLYHFQFKKRYRAEDGKPGQGKQKTGKNGPDLILEVPVGTILKFPDSDEILKDLSHDGESFVAAKGGRGGMGNRKFATSTNRSPRFAQPGEPGEEKPLTLELKLMADVGIIGLPNAGKSTLIHAISAATPRIGDYPFTTLTPTLAMVKPEKGQPFAVADIPGIIEDAHKGSGLGLRFLRHVERTRILVHMIDASGIDPQDPLCGYRTINHELACYSKTLGEKPQLIVLNKADLAEARERAVIFAEALPDQDISIVSAITRQGVDALILKIYRMLENLHE
jgi:GTP-binding protein